MIHEYDAVFGPFLHGPCGAGGHAPRPVAMVTRHEDEIYFWNASHPFGADGFNPAKPGAYGQPLLLLTMNFTGQTPNTFCAIMEEIKFTHGFLLVSSRMLRFKKPVSLL
jgi:hypothetical protein